MKKVLHYAGYNPHASGFGWATCNQYLRNALREHFEVSQTLTPDIVFMPLADHDFNPVTQDRAKVNLAYTFFEYPLSDKSVENARKYDVVFCGSSWCLDRMIERGITNGVLLIQGVDEKTFMQRGRIPVGSGKRIFSGGKFEYRKGQDLVIAAFREYLKIESSAHLVSSWCNPWPQLLQTMRESKCIKWDAQGNNQVEFFSDLLKRNGIPKGSFSVLPPLGPIGLAEVMSTTDFGVFPNRCEGGTNLVLMEYAACQRGVVANTKTGHADVSANIDYEIKATEDYFHWAEQTPQDVLEAMYIATYHPIPVVRQSFTWGAAAQVVANMVEKLLQA